jgi:dienelactone hydrolase
MIEVNSSLTENTDHDPYIGQCVQKAKRMIKKFCLTFAVLATASFSMVSAQQTAKVTASGIGYLEYLPKGYHSSSNKYPVVISLHGIREKGTSSTDPKRVLADLPRVDNVGLPKYVKFGAQYPFILISPQLKSKYGTWPPSYVMEVLNHVKKHLRIDEKRIYLTGLSLGGFGVWKTAGEYPHVFAAIAPICPGGNALNKASAIAAQNVAAWGFHGSSDKIVSYNVTTKMVNAINSSKKKPNPLAKATIFPGMGHIIWDKAYQQTNVLNWMLSFRKGSAPSFPETDETDNRDENENEDDNDEASENSSNNKAPIAKAGPDRTLTLPANSLYLRGNANDADGKVVSYKWTKVSGGTASLSGTTSPRLRVYNLRAGTYVFRLTVKDNKGAVKSDDVKVFVNAATEEKPAPEKKSPSNKKNLLPLVNAGPDLVLTLPENGVNITGRASDRDGKIVSYEWAKTYGGKVSFSGERSSSVRISDLNRGVYIFRLRVKDNDGGIKDDYFKITVNGGSRQSTKKAEPNATKKTSRGSNIPPVVSTGPDRVLTLPNNSIFIEGKASDRDGKVVSYQWTKTYGGRVSLSGDRTSRVRIYNLTEGPYIFRLTVKDNDGAVKHDYFKITVKPASREKVATIQQVERPSMNNNDRNARPVANAGSDRKVNLSRESITLKGSAYDPDGRIVSYQWKQLTGPEITVKNATSPEATLTDLKEGHYYFSLIVKDDNDAIHVDKTSIRITGS